MKAKIKIPMRINLVFQFAENNRDEGSAISATLLQSAETQTLHNSAIIHSPSPFIF